MEDGATRREICDFLRRSCALHLHRPLAPCTVAPLAVLHSSGLWVWVWVGGEWDVVGKEERVV